MPPRYRLAPPLACINQALPRFARIRNLMRTRLITAQSSFRVLSPNRAHRPSTSPGRFLNGRWDQEAAP